MLVTVCIPSPLLAAGLLALFSTTAVGAAGDDLVKKGDYYYDRLQPTEALKYYLPAEEKQPQNVELLVKISRQFRHLASDASRRADKIKFFDIGIKYSRRAVALAPNDPEAQLALAISLGKILPYLGNKQRIEYSKEIKASAEKVTMLDPNNDLGWHVLGRWHLTMADVGAVTRKLASLIYGDLPIASNEEAVRNFEKAIALNPKRLMHYIELGRTYAQMDRPTEARKYLIKGLSMNNTEKDDAETKKKGQEILDKLK